MKNLRKKYLLINEKETENKMNMNVKLLAIFSLAGLIASCNRTEKPVDLTAEKKQNDAKISLAEVYEKPVSTSIQLSGQLLPYNEVSIFPKVNGFVKELHVDLGSEVKKGDLLAVLEAPEMESQFQAANMRFVQAQENANASKEKYQRLKQAAQEPGAVSSLDLDNALAKMKVDQAIAESEHSNVEAVKTMIGYLRIAAPFDGTIIQRNISPGALVAPGKPSDQPLLILQEQHKMRLTVYIPEEYVNKVDLRKPVSFTFNALPDQEFTGLINRSANALSTMRSEAVEIDVINKHDELKPGMYAEVKIPVLSGAKSLQVPNNAIVRSTEGEYVIAVRDGKASLVNIKEGLISKESTEVFGDLKPNDKIILHPSDEIKQGDPVKI
jgi:RND family efflux transporter MFP subunit